MGKYHDWSDVSERYRHASTVDGSVAVNSSFLVFSEAEIESRLASHFTVPFSDNNLTVKDLCIDMSYARLAVGKVDDAEDIRASVLERINALKAGEMTMLTDSGDVVLAGASAMYSNTASYHTAFGVGNVLDFFVNSNQQVDEEGARD